MRRLMTRHNYWIFVVLVLIVSVSPGTLFAQQEVNLLANPGFEAPFESFSGGRQVAQGWQPWHNTNDGSLPSWQNAQPEYGPTAPDITRIRSGNDAQKYFNNTWQAHDGGVFQRVLNIEPGTELRFSVYAWVWSSAHENVNESEEPGDVILQVGIDPTGGTDGSSNNIVWSVPIEQYDTYRQYSVIARASSNAVSVWVRSRVGFPAANTFIYLDDAVLAATVDPTVPTDTEVPPPTNTAIPEPTDVPPPTDSGEDPTPTQESGLPTEVPPPTNTPIPPATATPVPTNTPLPSGGPYSDQFPNTLVHSVRRGDTISRLANLYGSSIDAILDANNLNITDYIYVDQRLIIPVPLAAPATSTPTVTPTQPPVPPTQVPPVGSGIVYTVQPGDNLSAVARRFSTTVAALSQLNGIVNPNLIRVGQQLQIPATGGPIVPPTPVPQPIPPQTYVVQPGDSLYRLSLRFGVSMWTLAQVNYIANVNRIFIGQVLVIP